MSVTPSPGSKARNLAPSPAGRTDSVGTELWVESVPNHTYTLIERVPRPMSTEYILVRHDEDGDGSVLYVPMGAFETSSDAVKGLKDLAGSGSLDLSTAVFSVFRRVYGDLKPRTQERVTVKLDGLAPSKPRGPRKAKAPKDA